MGILYKAEDHTGNVFRRFLGVFWVFLFGIWDGKGSPWSPADPRSLGRADGAEPHWVQMSRELAQAHQIQEFLQMEAGSEHLNTRIFPREV